MPAEQQQINYGNTANDGLGDPLRNAFIKTDNNFDAIWNAGPVGSNITILNNAISAVNTNGNVILSPQGVGIIQANASIIPSAANLRDLGSSSVPFRSGYFGYGGITATGNITADYGFFNHDVSVSGNLVVDGDIVEVGNIVTDALTVQLANTAATDAAANGAGVTVGANDDIATLLYNSTNNEWRTNIGANIAGNVTANYFIGDGSLLSNVGSDYGNANVAAYLPTYNGNINAGNIAVLNDVHAANVHALGFVLTGNLDAVNINAGNVFVANDVYARTGSFSGDAQGRNSLYAGFPSFTMLGSDVIAQLSGNSDTYTQFNFQNASNGAQASGDFVITADNGDDETYFLNIGLTGSNWNGTQDNSLGNLLGPNDGYFYVQDGNLVIGTKEDGNTHVHTWKWDTTGNVTATGNLIPSANLTYSLGNSTNWWSNIWVASNTIYIGGVALGVTGNVLTVGGEPVLSNDSSSSITTTGNLAASNISTGGTITANGQVRGQYFSGYNPDFYGDLGYSGGNIAITANVALEIFTDAYASGESGPAWSFGTDGDLTVPGYVQFEGNSYIGDEPGSESPAFRIVAPLTYGATIETDSDISGNSWTWSFGADGVLGAPGNITATNFIGNMAASNVTGLAAVATTGSYNDLSNKPTIPTLGNFTLTNNTIETGNGVGGITLSINGPDQGVPDPAFIMREWTFANTGAFVSPGAVSATGNITASANINSVGGTFTGNITAGNILTNNYRYANGDPFISSNYGDSNVVTLLSSFGSNTVSTTGNITGGNLITAGNITTSGTIASDNGSGYQTLIDPDGIIAVYNGNTVYTIAKGPGGGSIVAEEGKSFAIITNGAGPSGKEWTFTDTGNLTAPGNITAGNIDTDGQITVDALSITNSSIAAVTQFTISTSNTATGNSSSILMDRNGVGVVVQLEDTSGGPYYWGLYQDNILFPDGSRQYSAYGNANVVANLAALGSNPISTTGNITAANFIGNVSLTGNITGTSANVELVAGSYTWTFDNTGNTAFANGTVSANDVTLTGNISATVNGYNIGYREIPQITLSANATAALADSGKHFYSNTAGDLAILIPTNANVAFPTGTAFTVVVQAAGNVLVNADSGVTLYMAGSSSAGNRTVGAYGMATVMKVASDTWFINGSGVY